MAIIDFNSIDLDSITSLLCQANITMPQHNNFPSGSSSKPNNPVPGPDARQFPVASFLGEKTKTALEADRLRAELQADAAASGVRTFNIIVIFNPLN